jgi:methylmalonyl-CoA/ethylmalonyl-CoA epimerase
MNNVSKVHHINIVVRNLEQSVDLFQRILQCSPEYEPLPQRQVKTARFLLGETWLVLVQPLNQTSAVAKILATQGEGLFLLSLAVDSLTQSKTALQHNAINMHPDGPRQGLNNWQVWDIDMPSSLQSIFQICEEKIDK